MRRDEQQWFFDWMVKETGKVFHFQPDGRGRLPRSVRSHAMISKHVAQTAKRLERLAQAEAEGRGVEAGISCQADPGETRFCAADREVVPITTAGRIVVRPATFLLPLLCIRLPHQINQLTHNPVHH